MGELPATARRKFDWRTHGTFDTGWQTLTKCGLRVTWLNGQQEIDPGTGVVDCPDCLDVMAEDQVGEIVGGPERT